MMMMMMMRRAVQRRTISSSSLAYEFDLNGFVVLRNVLSQDRVNSMNDAIDAKRSEAVSRNAKELRNASKHSYFDGDGESNPRIDLGGCMKWEETDAFRELLVYPQITNALNLLIGKDHRLDHSPLILLQQKNSEGFKLHGGPMLADGSLNPELQYRAQNGCIWNSLVAVFVALTKSNGRSDGGLSLLRGSHKSNFATPPGYINGDDDEKCAFLDI